MYRPCFLPFAMCRRAEKLINDCVYRYMCTKMQEEKQKIQDEGTQDTHADGVKSALSFDGVKKNE